MEAVEHGGDVRELVAVAGVVLSVVKRFTNAASHCARRERANVGADAVDFVVSRRNGNLQEVSSAIFFTEVYAAPAAGEVQVGFFRRRSVSTVHQQLEVSASRDAVVESDFARQVNFRVFAEVERAVFVTSGSRIGVVGVGVNSVTADVAAKAQLQRRFVSASRGGSNESETSKSGRAQKNFFH